MVVAVLTGNAHLVRVLLVFGADANGVREKDGVSVRHLAAAGTAASAGAGGKKLSEAHKEIHAHLIAFGARPCPPPKSGSESSCLPGCLNDEGETVQGKLKALYGDRFHNNASHQLTVEKLLKERKGKRKEEVAGSSNATLSEEGSSSSTKTPMMMICFDGKLFELFDNNLLKNL